MEQSTSEAAQLPVVGGFKAADPLGTLDDGLLARRERGAPETDRLQSIRVLADSSAQVESVTRAVSQVLAAQDPSSIRLETSQTLAAVRAAVAGELGRYSRELVLTAMGVGLILVAVVVFGAVTLRRQDFGRRRALGATRATIAMLIGVQTVLVGIGGTVLGIASGIIIVWRLTGSLPEPGFTIAVAILALLTTVFAALPPALLAAYRDPVRVLRVP